MANLLLLPSPASFALPFSDCKAPAFLPLSSRSHLPLRVVAVAHDSPQLLPQTSSELAPSLANSIDAVQGLGSGSGSGVVKKNTVSVFWDLDNKPPKLSPYDAAVRLKETAAAFGDVVDMVAYANRHAFLQVPQWVREERRERREQDWLERRGMASVEAPYVCGLCGRKCKTNLDLRKHFKQLHEREREKRMNRLHTLRGKRKMRYVERIRLKNERYKDVARSVLIPKQGYGLAAELRRAGVYVRTVEDEPQAADIALKKHMVNSINRGIKCICLVSDDSDFSVLLTSARAKNLRTIVIGDTRALQRFADLWFPWDKVAQGLPHAETLEAVRQLALTEDLMQQLSHGIHDEEDSRFDPFRELESSGSYLEQSKIAEQHSKFGKNMKPAVRVSIFSEEEAEMEGSDEQIDEFLDDLSEDDWASDDDDAM
eukprot:c22719_g1_i1 orf=161-1444(+)